MRRRRHGGQRSARGYLESPKRPGHPERHPAWVLGLINARIPEGQRSFACISSRIATVIQVTFRAIKGTITDLMSHSQFHCTGRVYLDLHGLIFETSICYWQDQPGSPRTAGSAAGNARPTRASGLGLFCGADPPCCQHWIRRWPPSILRLRHATEHRSLGRGCWGTEAGMSLGLPAHTPAKRRDWWVSAGRV